MPPHARNVHETKIDSEQEQGATQEEDVLDLDFSVEEDEAVEGLRMLTVRVKTLECEVPPRQHSLLDGKTVANRKARGFQESVARMPILLEARENRCWSEEH